MEPRCRVDVEPCEAIQHLLMTISFWALWLLFSFTRDVVCLITRLYRFVFTKELLINHFFLFLFEACIPARYTFTALVSIGLAIIYGLKV